MAVNMEVHNSKPKIFNFSLGLFVIILIFTIWLYIFNYFGTKKIDSLNQELSQSTQNLETEKQDWYFIVYTKVQNSKMILDKYKNLSSIPEFVSNLETLSKEKNIVFNGFSYSDWKIKSLAKAQTTDLATASKKTQDFISYFREENNHIFKLDFVNFIEWQDMISFNVNFDLK